MTEEILSHRRIEDFPFDGISRQREKHNSLYDLCDSSAAGGEYGY